MMNKEKSTTNVVGEISEHLARVRKVFFPYADRRTTAVQENGGRFAYYTTAEVAVNMLRNKQVWMRNAVAMNDFMEISHGFECLHPAYHGLAGSAMKEVIEGCVPGVWAEVQGMFDYWLPTMRNETFMTCLSEHCPDEDEHGRLSMWRAYGGSTGVAIVINGRAIFSETNVLGAFTNPVQYANVESFAAELLAVAEGMKLESDYISALGHNGVRDALFTMLHFAMLCTKHQGFHEEREWRVIACPKIYPSSLLMPDVEVVRGMPQKVLKLKLQNVPEHGLVGLDVPELVDRIIIGPCEFPLIIYQAFVQLLEEAGMSDPANRVIVSDIPLRHIE